MTPQPVTPAGRSGGVGFRVALVVVLAVAAASCVPGSPEPDATNVATSVDPTTTSASAPAARAAESVRVVNVVDGDTIDVSGGFRVRLIGIDTPERGDCGAAEATSLMRSLLQGREVTLRAGARDSTDRYGRLLRYVDVEGTDAGLDLIRRGYAVARYDSRDGYGRHTREEQYVAADAASPRAVACER